MLMELGRNSSLWAVYFSEIFSIDVVDDAIGAVLETAQLDRPRPLPGEKGIVKFPVFPDHMSLRTIEPYVVKISEVFASRQHLVFVDAKPLLKDLLPLRGQVRRAVFLDKIWQHELRSDNPAHTHGGGEINRPVAQLDVVAKIRHAVAHESLQGLSLRADLKRTFRIGCDGHIEMWHGEERVGGTAGTKLHQRVRLHTAGGRINLPKEIGQRLDRIFRTLVMMGGIVARRDAVHVLAIKFKAVESPVSEKFPDQRFVVFHNLSVGWT